MELNVLCINFENGNLGKDKGITAYEKSEEIRQFFAQNCGMDIILYQEAFNQYKLREVICEATGSLDKNGNNQSK